MDSPCDLSFHKGPIHAHGASWGCDACGKDLAGEPLKWYPSCSHVLPAWEGPGHDVACQVEGCPGAVPLVIVVVSR